MSDLGSLFGVPVLGAPLGYFAGPAEQEAIAASQMQWAIWQQNHLANVPKPPPRFSQHWLDRMVEIELGVYEP